MGASQSNTVSSTDIANSFVSSAVINATSKNTTTASGSQSINISCTDAVATKAAELCSAEKAQFIALIPSLGLSSQEKVNLIQTYSPPVCSTCEISDVSQDMGITITASDINNNEVANKIQAELSSKLQEALKNTQSGVVGYSASNVESITKIKNYVDNSFNVNVVNEALKSFNFDQNITVTNAKAKNVSQKMVANVVASSIVDNAIKNDSSLKAAVDKATTAESKTSGVVDSILGAITALAGMGTILMIIAMIVGGFLIFKLRLHCAIPIFAPMCAMQSLSGDDSSNDRDDADDDADE